MLKLVGSDVLSVNEFVKLYRASSGPEDSFSIRFNPAALHRIEVGVPATVEHSSEARPETSKCVAETTQVSVISDSINDFLIKSPLIYVRAS